MPEWCLVPLLTRCAQVALISFFTLRLCAANHTPFRTEINYGPIPFDVYTLPNINAIGSPYIANCPIPTTSNPTTVRSCIQSLSANYVEGGATGVRFMFAVQGGYGVSLESYGASTAWDSEGNVQPAWTNNLNLFFADLKAAGFIYVAPTPVLVGTWSGPPYAPAALVNNCGSVQLESLDFYRWLPFGFESGTDLPDCLGIQDGYNLAARPPVINNKGFWGWQPYHNLIATVILCTIDAGMLLSEIDLSQEVNLADFTVMGRLIYDNTTNFDVLGDIQSLLVQNGLDPRVATYSLGSVNPSQANSDCLTGYNDSGMLYGASALESALAGGAFGYSSGFVVASGLPCGGTAPVSPTLPASYAVKPLIDIHTYPCIKGSTGCSTDDVTTTATLLYNDITNLIQHYGDSGLGVIIGETTPPGLASACLENRSASQNVAGYKASTLLSSGNHVVIRPWSWLTNSCYPNPLPLHPLYDSGTSITVTPNPLVGSSTVAQGTVSWIVPGSPTIEIHVVSPSGTLFARTTGSGSAVTGNWLTDGLQFFMQDVTSGKALTLANTVGIATAHVLPEPAALTATPQRINPGDGSGLGITNLRWSVPAENCVSWPCVEVHVDSPAGPLFSSGGSTGSATTEKWVKDGMVFYLVDTNTSQTLQAITVQVSPN
jgi:hypothetical protein